MDAPTNNASIAIIGAGIGGITQAVNLKRAGFHDFVIYERDVDVGGTWLTNTYPGCRCDVPATWYSLSTHLNPDWTESHPPQSEILAYWQKIAKTESIYPHIKFSTSFISSSYNTATHSHTLHLLHIPTDKPFSVEHKVIISAVGGFACPLLPDLKGYKWESLGYGSFGYQRGVGVLEQEGKQNQKANEDESPERKTTKADQVEQVMVDGVGMNSLPSTTKTPELEKKMEGEEEELFEGIVVHPSRYPRNGLDLAGKRVAVLGNGCSGTQLVPALSLDPTIQVYHFFRSAQWYAKGHVSPVSKTKRSLLRKLPALLRILRFLTYLQSEWVWFAVFPLSRKWFRGVIQWDSLKNITSKAPKELQGMMTPKFPMGAKRIVFNVDYVESLNRPNVTCVTDKIARLTKKGIMTENGREYPVDVIIVATGFDVYTGSVLDVKGKDGMEAKFTLSKPNAPRFYHGIMVPKIPNYFGILSSNTAGGHASVLFAMEVQAKWITDCLVTMRKTGLEELEVKTEAAKIYNDWLDEELSKTVWTQGNSFYRMGENRNGRIITNFPGPAFLYWWQNISPIWSDFVGLEKLAFRQKLKRAIRLILFTLAISGIFARLRRTYRFWGKSLK